MQTTLIIVESPAKCKKIESYLGSGYKCIASFGHVRELITKRGLKCIDINNNFAPHFKEIARQKDNIAKMKRLVTQYSDVILATDDDREGEAIAWHLCQIFKLPISTTKRIIFHEITKSAIQNAVLTPTTINMEKVHSQQARQVLDLLVGFTISPILWRHITRFKKESLSAGRCQTPALRLIYDNQMDINKTPGHKCYNITGYFTKHNLQFNLNTQIDSCDTVETFLEDSVEHPHMFSKNKPKELIKKCPEPLTTSAIQQKASNVLRYSPKDTMKICQNLYEAGYITYMRTDSKNYSQEFLDNIKKLIIATYSEKYIKPDLSSLSLRKTDDKPKTSKSTKKNSKTKKNPNNAQEAHEAIRPTDISRIIVPDGNKITNKEKRMYTLIRNHTLESCMADALYLSLHCKFTSVNPYHYKYSCEQVVFPGWKIVCGYEEVNPIYEYLKLLTTKKPIAYNKIKASYTIRDLKTHYTEAKLIHLLEHKGIGRPSTFSNIISKIQDRNYVKKQNVEGQSITCIDYELIDNEIEEIEDRKTIGGEKNKMVIQPTGIMVIEFLLKYFDSLFEYDYTKRMEDDLDKIANGNKLWYSLCKSCYDEMNVCVVQIKEEHKEKIHIDDNHVYMIGRYGPVIKTKIDDKLKFLKVKPDIDLNKLKAGELSLEDIIDKSATNVKNGSILGTHKGQEVTIHNGKFGIYVKYNTKTYSLKILNKPIEEIKLYDIIPFIEGLRNTNPNVLRTISPHITLRKGKYGPYLFYKTDDMNKPQFLKLKGFTDNANTCNLEILQNWIQDTYNCT